MWAKRQQPDVLDWIVILLFVTTIQVHAKSRQVAVCLGRFLVELWNPMNVSFAIRYVI